MKITYLDKYHYFNASIMPVNPTMVHVGVFGASSFEVFNGLYPKSRMIAYEADPTNFKAMEPFLSALGVEFHNMALNHETVPATLFEYGSSLSHSLFPRHESSHQRMELKAEVVVQGVTLSDIVDRDVESHIHLLILNCEGAEVFAIDSLLTNADLRSSIDQICVSFHAPRIYPMDRKRGMIKDLEKYYHVVTEKHSVGIPDVLLIKKR
ncbi:MAG: FkbM family methyltransferase [Methanosarcinales archaeon]